MKTKQTNLFKPELDDKTVKLVSLKMVCEEMGVYSRKVGHKQDVLDLVRPVFFQAYCEIVAVICLNGLNAPTAVSIVNIGSVNHSMVSPANVWKLALITNACSIILAHNHPAGSLIPSSADKEVTTKIKEGGKLLEIELLDHVIVNPSVEDCFSFRDNNLL